MSKPVGMLEVKQALYDQRFRDLFPEYRKEIDAFLGNPSCACNAPLYRKLLKEGGRIAKYFPGRGSHAAAEVQPPAAWQVINCGVAELEDRLRELRPGHVQVAVARYEGDVTVVVKYV